MNDMLEKERFTPGMQLAILLLAVGICWLVGGMITIGVAGAQLHKSFFELAENPKLMEENGLVARTSQIVGTFFMFALPTFILALFINTKKPFSVLGFNKVLGAKQVTYAVLITVAALWVSEALAIINQVIPLPQQNEAYFKNLEAESENIMIGILNLQNFGGFLTSLFIVAILPAVFEELLFRAGLQRVLFGLSRSVFLSIFITSLLFSFIHVSFYGFLSRFFLSMLLGYLYHYSKNIWINIIFHFINNAFAITVMYIGVQQGKTVKAAFEQTSISGNLSNTITLIIGLGLLAAIWFLFKYFKRESDKVLAAHAPAVTPAIGENDRGINTTNYL